MEMLTKEFFVEQFDSFRSDVKKEFDSVRSDMATKKDLEGLATKETLRQEISAVRADMATKKDLKTLQEEVAELTERATDAFTGITGKIVRVDAKIDTLIRLDPQHQIDVLRDDMRIVKTKLGLA